MFPKLRKPSSKEPIWIINEFTKSEVAFVSNSFKCLHIYSKFVFYQFISPLNPTLMENGILSFQPNLVYKIIYSLLTITTIVQGGFDIRKIFSRLKKIQEDPSQLYDMASIVCSVVGAIVFFHLNFVKHKGLSFLYSSFHKFCNGTRFLKPRWSIHSTLTVLICIFPLPGLFVRLWFKLSTILDAMQGDADALKLFELTSITPLFINGTGGSTSLLSLAIYSIRSLIDMHLMNLYNSFIVLFYVCCIVINQISVEFQQFLKDNQSATFEQVSLAYEDVKDLVDDINQTVGIAAIVAVLSGLTSLSRYLTIAFDADSWNLRLSVLTYFIHFVVALGLASAANLKFLGISEHIFRNRKSVTFKGNIEVANLLNEVHQNPLGLKAHKFIISFSFMATILSTGLTYVFILLQFQIKPK